MTRAVNDLRASDRDRTRRDIANHVVGKHRVRNAAQFLARYHLGIGSYLHAEVASCARQQVRRDRRNFAKTRRKVAIIKGYRLCLRPERSPARCHVINRKHELLRRGDRFALAVEQSALLREHIRHQRGGCFTVSQWHTEGRPKRKN
jgi:hypothetical protein